MSDRVTIKSSRGDLELEFSRPRFEDRGQTCTIRTSLNGICLTAHLGDVYLYEPRGLAEFFQDIASNWKGWDGEKIWETIEDDLTLVVTSDRLGHIAMRVGLRSYSGEWKAEAPITIEAGQLDQIATEIRRLLRV